MPSKLTSNESKSDAQKLAENLGIGFTEASIKPMFETTDKCLQDLFKDKLKTLEKELNNINKELQNKSSYFQRLYEDRTSGILPEKEFLILMNKYKDDTAKLEERMKIIKKDIATTITMKESLKSKKKQLLPKIDLK